MTPIAEKPITGRHVLIILLSFFAVVLIANLTMVYFARHSWTGLVVRNSYVASQEFNAKTAEMVKATVIKVRLEADRSGLKAVLNDSAGQPVNARSVVLKLGRPSHEGADRSYYLAPRGPGIFAAPDNLSNGQWSGMISAEIAGQENWMRPVYLLVKE